MAHVLRFIFDGLPGKPLPVDPIAVGFLDRTFELEQRGTTPVRELLAGVTTFMALSYIVSLALALR